MSDHTPGPWKYQHATGDITSDHPPYPFRLVARTYLREHPHSLMMGGEDEANARLIASAPELLAALKALVDECTDRWGEDSLPSEVYEAREAIAKAKGEKP